MNCTEKLVIISTERENIVRLCSIFTFGSDVGGDYFRFRSRWMLFFYTSMCMTPVLIGLFRDFHLYTMNLNTISSVWLPPDGDKDGALQTFSCISIFIKTLN